MKERLERAIAGEDALRLQSIGVFVKPSNQQSEAMTRL